MIYVLVSWTEDCHINVPVFLGDISRSIRGEDKRMFATKQSAQLYTAIALYEVQTVLQHRVLYDRDALG